MEENYNTKAQTPVTGKGNVLKHFVFLLFIVSFLYISLLYSLFPAFLVFLLAKKDLLNQVCLRRIRKPVKLGCFNPCILYPRTTDSGTSI